MPALKGARYGHVGGGVVTDHGRVSLAEARALVVFYVREARSCMARDDLRAAHLCAHRALALFSVARRAALWRRAAGWDDPEAADG